MATPTVDTPPPPPPPRKKLALHWRIARHTVRTVIILIFVVVGAGYLVLRNLDTSFIKTRLRSLAQHEAGLELDYGSAQVNVLSGIVLNDFTVAQPPALRAIAPNLLQAEMLQLGWSLFGQGPMLRHFVAADVTLTIIVDDDGATSLDTLGKKDQKKEPTPTPGQQLLAALRGLPEFDRLQLAPLTVEVLLTHDGKVRSRTQLSGLDLRAVATGLGDDRTVELQIGTEKRPLPIALLHDDGTVPIVQVREADAKRKGKKKLVAVSREPQATGTIFVDGKLAAKEAGLRAQLTLDRQTVDKDWPKKGVLLAVDARARSDGDILAVDVQKLDAFVEAVVARGALAVAPGKARVQSASGTVDLTRLARLVPAARLPFALREGQTKYDVAGLEVDRTARLDPGGHLDVDVRASGLRLGGEECAAKPGIAPAPGCAALGSIELNLEGVRLALHGRPLPSGGLQLAATLPAETMTLTAKHGVKVALTHANTDLQAELPTGAPGKIEVRTKFDTLGSNGHIGRLDAQAGNIDTKLTELRIDTATPAHSSGALATSLSLGALTTTTRGATARANDLKLAVHARVSDGEPSALDLASTIGRFSMQNARDLLVPPGPAQLDVKVDKIKLDRQVPLYSLAEVKLHSSMAQITVAASLSKQKESVLYDLAVDAERAGLLTAFAPPSLGLPARMSFALKSKGRVDDLLSPRLKQSGSLHVEHGAVNVKDSTVAAEALDVTLDSDGDARRHEVKLMVSPHKLQLDDDALGDGTLALHGKWDASRPAFDIELDGKGTALPAGHVSAALAWEPKAKVLTYKIDGQLGNLEALSPILPASITDEHWIDLSDLTAKLSSRGQLAGVILGFDKRSVPILAKNPLGTLRGDDDLHLVLQNFHYVDAAGVELTMPSLELTTHITSDGTHHHGEAKLEVADAAMTARKNKIAVNALVDSLSVDLDGDPRTGPLEVTHKLSVGRMRQDAIPLYPIGFITQETHARRTKEGELILDRFELDNGAGGTHLTAHGNLTLARAISRRDTIGFAQPVGFSSLGLYLTVTQALDKLTADPGRFAGKGTVVVAADLMSGDLRRYHATASAKFQQASFALPTASVRVTNLDGTLPVVEDFVIDKGKLRLFNATQGNAYPQLRFADQHPFQSSSGALSVERIDIRDLDISDLAGNVRIARNALAIDQLDAGMRGGRIAGQCRLDWKGGDSTLSLRVRMTGIEARHKGARERFDGNAALDVSLRDRDIDGRIEILRIGRQHLYDLLDEVDAHHKDAAINRVRSALELGYPDRVQVIFDRGFASMQVKFGGLARLVKVHEVHGIPTGPLVERYLGPLLSLESP